MIAISAQDEVKQILAGPPTLKLNPQQNWNEIEKDVSRNIIPAIDRAINGRIRYNQAELKHILQQLHRHQRENQKISQDEERKRQDKQRKGINSQRSDVSIFKPI